MTIKISKASLSEALNNVQVAVAAKAPLAILQNVKMTAKEGKLELTCSDMDVTLTATADCEVVAEGSTTVPAKTFATAVGKAVDGVMEISVDSTDCATLKAGPSTFRFKGLPASEFPSIPSDDGVQCSIECSSLKEMLRKTSFAASQDDTRRTLQGVLLDFGDGGKEVKAVATDGRRLAILNCDMGESSGFNGQFIIPKKAVDIIQKKLPKDGKAILNTAKSQLRITTPRFDILTKLLDEVFPNYMQVVPKSTKETITVNRVDLLGALDRSSVLTSSDSPTVNLTFKDNCIELNSSDADVGSSHDEVPIKYNGEVIELRFNPQYVREVLSALDEDEIEFKLTNGASPAIIRKSGADDYTYVVMPLRVSA